LNQWDNEFKKIEELEYQKYKIDRKNNINFEKERERE